MPDNFTRQGESLASSLLMSFSCIKWYVCKSWKMCECSGMLMPGSQFVYLAKIDKKSLKNKYGLDYYHSSFIWFIKGDSKRWPTFRCHGNDHVMYISKKQHKKLYVLFGGSAAV
jgi:hypothetical protein